MFSPLQFLRKHFYLFVISAVISIGWLNRESNYLTAETGAGYMLGIVGGSLMIVLLLYPLSKRVKLMTQLVPIRYWFGIHMFLGVVGPLMVLFHSNFHLGSTNSSIALICMILVAGSGLVGRYIYTNIHHGLYGSRITLKELKQDTANNHSELLKMYDMDEILSQRLTAMEDKALQPHSNLFTSMFHVMSLAINAQQIKRTILKLVDESYNKKSDRKNTSGENRPDSKAVIKSVNHYTLALRRAAAFKLYERLFSLWHVLHLPLFFMMIITAIIHIFAVHLY